MEFAESFGAFDAMKVSNSKISHNQNEQRSFGNIDEGQAENISIEKKSEKENIIGAGSFGSIRRNDDGVKNESSGTAMKDAHLNNGPKISQDSSVP